jgi:hypothetical protein
MFGKPIAILLFQQAVYGLATACPRYIKARVFSLTMECLSGKQGFFANL